LVQDVIAAISTSPEPSSTPSLVFTRFGRSAAALAKPLLATGAEYSSANLLFSLPSSMRSCGRFGPAREVRTVSRSSSSDSE
jgi:hypothetical protein